MDWNIPNILTLGRVIAIPFFILSTILEKVYSL
jgi:phosphatidylglycerophosphate synthase